MPEGDQNIRLNDILDMIGRLAALDFSKLLPVSDKYDRMDAIALGLNMLSEELNANVVEKAKLDEVNSKLEKFAYTTAHDLKSPLNAIEGLLRLLEESIEDNDINETKLYISTLNTAVVQMRELVEDILIYSKADAQEVKQEKINLNVVFEDIVKVESVSNNATIRKETTLPMVYFSRSAIYQIFRNLVSNAIKHCDKENCEIVIRAKEKDDHHQVMISDNGPGIAPENQEVIFELFNKIDTSSQADSHGIGLATVKSLLEAHGERIWVESDLGKGATFYFTLTKPEYVQGI